MFFYLDAFQAFSVMAAKAVECEKYFLMPVFALIGWEYCPKSLGFLMFVTDMINALFIRVNV